MAIKTKQELVEWIKRRLGYPVIQLEIENQQILDCIEDALLLFNRHSGDTNNRMAYVLVLSADVQEYDIPENVEAVLGFDNQADVGSSVTVLFSPINQMYNQGYINFFSSSFGGGLTTFEMGMQYLELMHNTLEAQYQIDFNKYTHKLKIYPKPVQTMVGVLDAWVKYVPGENEKSTLYDEWWVREYAVALSKIILGHIWSKYTGMVIPGGATLNGAQMLQQGLVEKKELEDKLISLESEPLGFFVE
jgi:hypothetical protein